MTSAPHDKLQKTLSGLKIDSRISTWLWLYLKNQNPYANLGELGSPGMRDRMADFIQNTSISTEHIEAQSAYGLLPEKELEWITNSKRQNLFIFRKLIEQNGYIPITGPTSLKDRELTIATIDILPAEKSQKAYLLNIIKSAWAHHSSSDHIFKWLDDEDPVQKLATAWEITKSKYPPLALDPSIPHDKDEFIDLLEHHSLTIPERELLMLSIKKRWSQNKYRAKLTGKKQYNFTLSDKAINSLDKLAEKYNLRRVEILEILLQMEDEKELYIPERLRLTK